MNRCTRTRIRFAHEIIWSNVMSREKALIIGHERRKDAEVLVDSLAHLNTASLFVITKEKSQYISRLENVGIGQYDWSALSSRVGSLIFVLTSPPFSNHYLSVLRNDCIKCCAVDKIHISTWTSSLFHKQKV